MATRVVLWGSVHPALGQALCARLGLPSPRFSVAHFPDGEIQVAIDEPVGGAHVTIVQPTSPPVGESVLELALLSDACRRAGASTITAVIPYFGYARQDRRSKDGEPLGVRVVSDVIGSHVSRIIAVDLHSSAAVSAASAIVDHLSAAPSLAKAVRPHLGERAVVVAPDLGAAKLARRFGEWLDLPVAIVHKTRVSGSTVSAHGIVGNVRGLQPVIVDDMISTAGTIEAAARVLVAEGASPDLLIAATHALLVGPAVERLRAFRIARFVCTDSVPQRADLPFPHDVVPLAPLLADALRRLDRGEPLGELIAIR